MMNVKHKFSFDSKVDDLLMKDWDPSNMDDQGLSQNSLIDGRIVELMSAFQGLIAKTTINSTTPFNTLENVISISRKRKNCFSEASLNEFISMHNLWKNSDQEMKPAWSSFKVAEIQVQGKFQYEGEALNEEMDAFFDLFYGTALCQRWRHYIFQIFLASLIISLTIPEFFKNLKILKKKSCQFLNLSK
ncbi:MAG: hypothetical protein H0T62_02440 [Parachlamydiaceae bacterium]|nr:hypothetical protein [Parachlamydiaceae bacterium]